MLLPPQKIGLTVIYNKMQLITLIVESLLENYEQLSRTGHKLVVTGEDPTPLEVYKGVVVHREDLRNIQEETDVIMIHQLLRIANENRADTDITVIADDTCVHIADPLLSPGRSQMSCQNGSNATR